MSIGKVDVRKGMQEIADTIQLPIDLQDTTDTGKERITSTLTDEITAAESALRSIGGNSPDIDVSNYTHLVCLLDVSAVGGDANETLDVDVEILDPISGNYEVIASFVQCTQPEGVQMRLLHVGPDTANNVVIGSTIRLTWAIAGTTPTFTFSICVIPKSSS